MSKEDLSADEAAIRARLDAWLKDKPYKLNPDQEAVQRVIHGLAVRQKKFGKLYCPCRVVTRNPAEDEKIICPCIYHEEELAQKGICHCQLLVSK